MQEYQADILIVGGGAGGVAAALAALRDGASVIIVEPTGMLGGQFTVQGVPPDENQWVETFGCNRSYAALREGVRRWYRTHRPLTPAAMADARLNPGGGWVSRLCAEPMVWHAVMMQMLTPFIQSGQLRVITRQAPVAVEMEGDLVRAVLCGGTDELALPREHSVACAEIVCRGRFVLDASEFGDVLELGAIESAIGGEKDTVYGELHGRSDKTHPHDQQACSWCFALEHRPGEDHTISRPAAYDFWRSFVPQMRDGTSWTGPLFSWLVPSHNEAGKREFRMVPWPDEPASGEWEMWRYRRIVDRAVHLRGSSSGPDDRPPDVSLINMVQMDYWLRPLLGVSVQERREALLAAREQSLCLLYWMQTEAPRHAPRHDGARHAGDPGLGYTGLGYPGLKLRGDELGTSAGPIPGLAQHVYVREPRRLLARTIMTEAHIGTEQRQRDGHATDALNWSATPFGTAERFADSVAIGHYTIDLHPSCAGRNSVYVPCAPFRVPMGALIPRRIRNVLAAGKCLGVSHVVNASTRMHTTEWAVGEAAGALAAWCIRHETEPHEVHENAERVREVQEHLARSGMALSWPWET